MFRQQRLLNQLRHARWAQPALSVATVQPCLQLAKAFGFIGHFEERLPFRSTCYWKSINQVYRHHLCHPGRVEVRQVTALVPAAEAKLSGLSVWRVMPLLLGFDQSAQTGVARMTKLTWRR